MRASVRAGCVFLGNASGAWAGGSHREDLTNDRVVVGEGRYVMPSGTTEELYANAYHDGSAELSLLQNYPVGYLPNATDSVYITAAAYIIDLSTTYCENPVVRLSVYEKSGVCDTSSFVGMSEFKRDTCRPAGGSIDNTHTFYGGALLTVATQRKSGFHATINTVDAGGSSTFDVGCFNVGNSLSACF